MLSSRFQGLLSLHGVLVVFALLLLFMLLAVFGVEASGHFEYGYINFPLYMGGIGAAGVIFFNFYPMLGSSLLKPDRARVFQVTNLQIFVLLLVLLN